MYVCIWGYIILKDQKVRQYGPERNQGLFLFVCLFIKKNMIKAIILKLSLIVADSQSTDDATSTVGVKRRLVA